MANHIASENATRTTPADCYRSQALGPDRTEPSEPAQIPLPLTTAGACPVVVISYNNHPFVQHTLAQLRQLGVCNVIVLDNASTWDATQQWLDGVEAKGECSVIRNTENHGHLCWQRPEIIARLPDLFCVTDPDLLFSASLPANFIAVLSQLALQQNAMKVGFALDLTDSELMFDDTDYHRGSSIVEWERRFWVQPVEHPSLQLYLADIDTTFHVYNKHGNPRMQLRVAGDYAAKHLPWYKHDPVFGPELMSEIYGHGTSVSTMARLHMRYHHGPSAMNPRATTAPREQAPARLVVDHDLLRLMPAGARRVVQVGSMCGALAQAYRVANPDCRFTAVDIDDDNDPEYAKAAKASCDEMLAGNLEQLSAELMASLFPSDCWVLSGRLEQLSDPWRLVRSIREHIDADGCLVASFSNSQHWSVQMRLATGLFRYEDNGLLARSHLRWFTRLTMTEMFQQAGWRVDGGISRSLPQPAPAPLLAGIRAVATAAGADADQAAADAEVFQYLFKFIPA